jgi:CheY-like chemotaxis protein
MLARYGVAPFVAEDGAQAVALACGQDFDLILMDLNMPVLDGLAATKQIRRYEHEHDTVRAPVLAYTSQLLDADLLRDCGVDGVLEKPCSDSALQACLLRWCVPRSRVGSGISSTANA